MESGRKLSNMEVKNHGIFIREAKCGYCGCEFYYSYMKDIQFSHNDDREHTFAYKYVKCPECNHEVKID